MSFLLDTNACIAALNGRPSLVRDRIVHVRSAGGEIIVSSIALFELWHGVGRSRQVERNAERLVIFRDSVKILPFEEEDARIAGGIEAELRTRGTPIGPYDILMAGQAIRWSLTLVTTNLREFSRVQGLQWEDWGKSMISAPRCYSAITPASPSSVPNASRLPAAFHASAEIGDLAPGRASTSAPSSTRVSSIMPSS